MPCIDKNLLNADKSFSKETVNISVQSIIAVQDRWHEYCILQFTTSNQVKVLHNVTPIDLLVQSAVLLVQNPNMIAKRIHYKMHRLATPPQEGNDPHLDNGCYFATYFDLGARLVQRVPVKVFIVNQ